MPISFTCTTENLSVPLPAPLLVVEVGNNGTPYGDIVPDWYIDAAHLTDAAGAKVRDLSEDEIDILERDDIITAYACEAIHQWEDNRDPTP